MTLTPPSLFGAPRSLEQVGGASSLAAEAGERVEHLRGTLRAVRGIHLLVARERDPARLIERTAALLVEARGIPACCIAVGAPGRVTLRAQAGVLAQAASLRRLLDEGAPPACLSGPMREGSLFVRHGRSPDCDRCPIEQEWSELRDTVGVPLIVDGQIHGALVAGIYGLIAFVVRRIRGAGDVRRQRQLARLSEQLGERNVGGDRRWR